MRLGTGRKEATHGCHPRSVSFHRAEYNPLRCLAVSQMEPRQGGHDTWWKSAPAPKTQIALQCLRLCLHLVPLRAMRGAGIVELAARGMLTVSVVWRLGSEGPLLACCAAPL